MLHGCALAVFQLGAVGSYFFLPSSSAAHQQHGAAVAAHKRSATDAMLLDLGTLPAPDRSRATAVSQRSEGASSSRTSFLQQHQQRCSTLQGLDQDIAGAQQQLQQLRHQIQQAKAEHDKILHDSQLLQKDCELLQQRQQEQLQQLRRDVETAAHQGEQRVLLGDSSDEEEEGGDCMGVEEEGSDRSGAPQPSEPSGSAADAAAGPGPSSQLMALIQALPGNYSGGILVLELFSGAGTHSTLVSSVLINQLRYGGKHDGKQGVNISRLTVDNAASCKPHLLADLGLWTAEHTSAVQARYPNKHVIVLASPPCQHYSVANTTSRRPLQQRLQEADRLVQAAIDIYQSLGDRGLAMLLENPGIGRLRGRKVVTDFFDNLVIFDYCQYGGVRRKRTAIWSTFSLKEYGFRELKCDPKTCNAVITLNGRRCHCLRWEQTGTSSSTTELRRQGVPAQVSLQAGMAICKCLLETWQPPTGRARRT